MVLTVVKREPFYFSTSTLMKHLSGASWVGGLCRVFTAEDVHGHGSSVLGGPRGGFRTPCLPSLPHYLVTTSVSNRPRRINCLPYTPHGKRRVCGVPRFNHLSRVAVVGWALRSVGGDRPTAHTGYSGPLPG